MLLYAGTSPCQHGRACENIFNKGMIFWNGCLKM